MEIIWKPLLYGFDKEFRTYNNEDISIKIVDAQENRVIAEYDNIYQSPVQDWKKYKFEFEKQKESETKQYKIVINYKNGTTKNAVLYNSKKEFDKGILKVNGEEKNANISFEIYYQSKYAIGVWILGMAVLNIVAIFGIWFITYKKEMKIEKMFLYIVIPMGVLYAFIMPVYRGHDEHAHFFRAYEISRGVLNTKIKNNMSITSIPGAFESVIESKDRYFNEAYYEDVIKFLKTEIIKGDNTDIDGCYMAVYSPLPYIPQAFAIRIVDTFTNNVAVIFYAARLVNLIITVLILYKAIKIIPYGKKIIFLIAIIPTTMTQISSMSPDATTLSACILFIAYILKILHEKTKIKKKETVILCILGSAIALSKIVYIPFILLSLLIPKDRYENSKKRKISKILTIVLPILINIIWLSIANTHLSLIDNNKASVQTAGILSNIPEYARTVIYTLQHIIGTIFNELFGGNLMHNDLVSNGMIITLPMIILVVLEVLLDDEIKNRFDLKFKWAIGLVLFVITGLIVTSLYVQWSPLQWFFVNGIQGRYFLPLLLPLVLLLGQNKWVEKVGNVNLKKIMIYSAIIINFYALAQIIITFI